MLRPVRNIYISARQSASDMNRVNIAALVGAQASAEREKRLLDLGCDDGVWTAELARVLRAKSAYGVEIVAEAAATARRRGIRVSVADLNTALPFRSASFDLIHANQVIEHVSDIDIFVSEIRRLLRPGGAAVVSTENGSSWHNIFAAIMGWQVFSLTNVSGKVAGLGNPFAVHRGSAAFSPTWRHKTIMNYLGLIELFRVHGFREIEMKGAGYFPLPAGFGRLDVRHAAFLALKASV